MKFATLALATLVAAPALADSASTLASRADHAAEQFTKIMAESSTSVSQQTWNRARCVVVIPKIVKAGFIVGAESGEGLVSCRTTQGWSLPSFVSYKGASLGVLGGKIWNLVLILAGERAVASLYDGKLVLDGEVSVTFGNDTGSASGAVTGGADVYAFSSATGFFLSTSFGGSKLDIERGDNENFYGQAQDLPRLLATPATAAPRGLNAFLNAISRY